MIDETESPVIPLREDFGWDGNGLPCPKCGSSKLLVYDSRPHAYTRRRHRCCKSCGHTFYTMEVYTDRDCDDVRVSGPKDN